MGEQFDNLPTNDNQCENNTYDSTSPVPDNPYSDLYEKYKFAADRLFQIAQEEQINISENDEIMYIDLAWQAISKYIYADYDDSAMIQRCSFAIAQLAYIYYHNEKVKRSIIRGVPPVTQMTMGSESITLGSKKIELDNSGLTPEIKAVLPPRRLRAF